MGNSTECPYFVPNKQNCQDGESCDYYRECPYNDEIGGGGTFGCVYFCYKGGKVVGCGRD
jgi:hypothetical protein